MLTAHLLSASIATPILGRVGDMIGKERVFVVLAGPIVDVLGYCWLFWLPMIITVAAAVSAVLFVPESPVRTPGRISWLPAVLLSAWLVALLVALSEAPDWGWGSARVIGLLAAAVVLAAGWVIAELRAATPLIDMKMMRRTAMSALVVAAVPFSQTGVASGQLAGMRVAGPVSSAPPISPRQLARLASRRQS